MSLVTRCPACSTTFKVVADQLRVSQGWVRCGSCSDVFDANAYLQSVCLPAAEEASQDAGYAQDKVACKLVADYGVSSLGAVTPTGKWLAEMSAAHTAAKQLEQTASLKNENAAVDVNIDRLFSVSRPAAYAAEVVISAPTPDVAGPDATVPDFHHVSFIRKARREAFWQQPFVRLGLTFLAGFCVVLLGIQWTVHHKDQIIAAEPRFFSVFQAVCKPLKCRVKPLQRIESLLIDSVSFVKLDSKSFRLSFVLKNTADTPLEVPSLELTLSDAQDRPVVRRVVSPVQFGTPVGVLLAAHSDTGGVVNLTVAPDESSENPMTAAMVAGYRVLIFYP